MGMVVEQPEVLEGAGGKYVDKPGYYHIVWTDVDENPVSKNGEALDGIKATFMVLAGTNADQKDRTQDTMLWNPKPDEEKAKQDRAKRKQTAFCLATCLIGQFQPGVRTTVEPKEAIGRQSVVKIVHQRKQNETTGEWEDDPNRVEIAFSDIYHVDDEWVKKNNVPLDAKALGVIPASLRKLPPPSLAEQAAVPATAATVDVGDV